MKRTPRSVIVGVTGSIAIYKACELVRILKDFALDPIVIMTKEAQELIRPITFVHLSGNRVYSELFPKELDWDSYHVNLARRAKVIAIAPATANIIAKLAAGLCDDLLTSTVIASKAKVLIAPAMHEAMWLHAATRENVEKLKRIGYQFIGPVRGKLASGDMGWGRFAEPADIAKMIKKFC